MSIKITTTHTITCENAPVEDVLKELQEKFREVGQAQTSTVRMLIEDKDRLTRERDELQKRLEESRAINQKLMAENKNLEAANEVILAGGSRPALPEGMRIAEHPEYGRVVVSPGVEDEGDYKVFAIEESASCKADYWYAAPADLTFLDKEPAPAPLPKPEDCKAGELYLAEVSGREVVAKRCAPKDGRFPWVTYATADDYSAWCSDSQITLLARLLPDRDIKERA